eukprot:TRINITY_DN6900_c0_g1_i2.p1 TRINITY_DN6900_c0_g1~~TRINITY_DN6900_c0_g1_i2.p1  ORF type:complete len:113 (+),score=17.60 TRINITY_DN6900_c0_g1_i2:559-897(+)
MHHQLYLLSHIFNLPYHVELTPCTGRVQAAPLHHHHYTTPHEFEFLIFTRPSNHQSSCSLMMRPALLPATSITIFPQPAELSYFVETEALLHTTTATLLLRRCSILLLPHYY